MAVNHSLQMNIIPCQHLSPQVRFVFCKAWIPLCVMPIVRQYVCFVELILLSILRCFPCPPSIVNFPTLWCYGKQRLGRRGAVEDKKQVRAERFNISRRMGGRSVEWVRTWIAAWKNRDGMMCCAVSGCPGNSASFSIKAYNPAICGFPEKRNSLQRFLRKTRSENLKQ